jgi:hypothetical protein
MFWEGVLNARLQASLPLLMAIDSVPTLEARKVADYNVAAAVWVETIGVARVPRRFKH